MCSKRDWVPFNDGDLQHIVLSKGVYQSFSSGQSGFWRALQSRSPPSAPRSFDDMSSSTREQWSDLKALAKPGQHFPVNSESQNLRRDGTEGVGQWLAFLEKCI